MGKLFLNVLVFDFGFLVPIFFVDLLDLVLPILKLGLWHDGRHDLIFEIVPFGYFQNLSLGLSDSLHLFKNLGVGGLDGFLRGLLQNHVGSDFLFHDVPRGFSRAESGDFHFLGNFRHRFIYILFPFFPTYSYLHFHLGFGKFFYLCVCHDIFILTWLNYPRIRDLLGGGPAVIFSDTPSHKASCLF